MLKNVYIVEGWNGVPSKCTIVKIARIGRDSVQVKKPVYVAQKWGKASTVRKQECKDCSILNDN